MLGIFTKFIFHYSKINYLQITTCQQPQKNVIKTMLTISIVFVLCWTPNTVYFILYSARSDIPLSGPIYAFTVYCVFGNAIINPFIYRLQYAPFQHQVKKLFCRNQSEGDSVATISSRTHSYIAK